LFYGGNLKGHQVKLFHIAKDFNSFLVIILSEHNKAFAVFVPYRFEKIKWKLTDKQTAFYWINDDELVKCENSRDPRFYSSD
jgi:hypothetical protein